jgi:hypothetical protein
MIIENRNVKDELFCFSPVFYLTGCVETAKFYSALASASSKFGTFLENQVRDLMPQKEIVYTGIKSCEVPSKLKKKTKIDGVEPDFIVVNPQLKTIDVYEIKATLYNMDSKQSKQENRTCKILQEHFAEKFSEFKTTVYLVNFLEFVPKTKGGKETGKSTLRLTNNFEHIGGREFCEKVSLSYDEVLNLLRINRQKNKSFIENYKSKEIVIEEPEVSVPELGLALFFGENYA